MSKPDFRPSRRRRVCAGLLALGGIAMLVLGVRASTRVFGAMLLLSAWDLMFEASLPLNLTFGQMHEKVRQGWRMTRTGRLIAYTSFGLAILATYLQLHGR